MIATTITKQSKTANALASNQRRVDEENEWHPIPACAVSNYNNSMTLHEADSFLNHRNLKLEDYDDCIDALLVSLSKHDYVGKEKPKRTRRNSIFIQVAMGKGRFQPKLTHMESKRSRPKRSQSLCILKKDRSKTVLKSLRLDSFSRQEDRLQEFHHKCDKQGHFA